MDSTSDAAAGADPQRDLAEQVAEKARAFVTTMGQSGAPLPESGLDYSPESLAHLDSVLQEFAANGIRLPTELVDLAASYISEVVRGHWGGRYVAYREDDPVVLIVGEPAATVGVLAHTRVRSRIDLGPRASLAVYFALIGAAVERGGPPIGI